MKKEQLNIYPEFIVGYVGLESGGLKEMISDQFGVVVEPTYEQALDELLDDPSASPRGREAQIRQLRASGCTVKQVFVIGVDELISTNRNMLKNFASMHLLDSGLPLLETQLDELVDAYLKKNRKDT